VDPVAQAASILLFREQERQLFVVERARSLRFFGGFLAFPGGKVMAEDADTEFLAAAGSGLTGAARPADYVAAARELFEETGVLLARDPEGKFPRASECVSLRRALVDGTESFKQLLKRARLAVARTDLNFAGSLVTPPFMPARFDTKFFLASPPHEQQAEVWPGELAAGYWGRAGDILHGWQGGNCLVSPPTISILEAVRAAGGQSPIDALESLFQRALRDPALPIQLSPGVELIPLRTAALPPSTHTNAYLVGTGPVYLIDPGAAEREEQDRLLALLEDRAAHGRRLSGVLLTHHHADHVGAAELCARRFDVPILAHAMTAARVGKIHVDQTIDDGERLELGTSLDGRPDWTLEVLHTPGHAPGHLAFLDRRYGVLFAGDLVSTQSSVVIAPPDGDLTIYLHSLERLKSVSGCRLLLPAHGTTSCQPSATIEQTLIHRARREAMLIELLRGGTGDVGSLARQIYEGVPDALMGFAELQVLSGLEKLRREGLAQKSDTGEGSSWRTVP
jgi:glyoxylase-like metal-dependent hydrolase (beta-lactamase superfamily II)/8-oxo-dGTP pyrophosphatase MutT (NUDIX family)